MRSLCASPCSYCGHVKRSFISAGRSLPRLSKACDEAMAPDNGATLSRLPRRLRHLIDMLKIAGSDTNRCLLHNKSQGRRSFNSRVYGACLWRVVSGAPEAMCNILGTPLRPLQALLSPQPWAHLLCEWHEKGADEVLGPRSPCM